VERLATLVYHVPVGIQQTSLSRYGKRLGAALGLTAVASMITLSIVFSDSGGQAKSVLAGSGGGSGNGMYTQPAVPGMNVGETETQTTPGRAPATLKATPVVRAHG
jgi:hypothetical protein